MCIAWKNRVAEVNFNHNIDEQKKVQSVNMDFMYLDFDMNFRYLDLMNIIRVQSGDIRTSVELYTSTLLYFDEQFDIIILFFNCDLYFLLYFSL